MSPPARDVLPSVHEIREWLREVKDPEVPVVDIVDLGIVRDVVIEGSGVRVDLTPTYSGCPALEVIETAVKEALTRRGLGPVTVRRVVSPAWTTEWISEAGREKLRAYGIAPPGAAGEDSVTSPVALGPTVRVVACPYCLSGETECRSWFGPTACKAIFVCRNCCQPFEYFKPH